MPQLVARAALAVVAAVLIPSCYGTHLAPPRAPGAAAYNFDFVGPDGTGHISVSAPRSLTLRELVLQTDRGQHSDRSQCLSRPGGDTGSWGILVPRRTRGDAGRRHDAHPQRPYQPDRPPELRSRRAGDGPDDDAHYARLEPLECHPHDHHLCL